ncbi:MAG: Flp pilus assembly protein CpaB [Pirellulales bacterium]|nr:Flp pilus assembly protein CpaB [Pirellulales bacterium]
MRAKSLALLMLALGCGLVASIGITQVMAKRDAAPTNSGETESIFIAVKDIPLGERLTTEALKLEAWPKDKIPPGACSKIEDIEGCRTRAKLYAGEPILAKKLLGKGASLQGDSALIPAGYRVVPVKVDNVSGGPGLITPGDRVDVLVHLTRNPHQEIYDTSTRTILQDIKVFAVNDIVDIGEQKESKDKEKLAAKTISLLVTPAQAAKLTLASEMGKVRLIMRSPDDNSNSLDGNSSPSELFGGSSNALRDKEKLFAPDTPPAAPKNTGLTNLLDDIRKNMAARPKVTLSVVPSETWTMRLLQPNGINELILEADTGPHAAKMPQGAWHLSSANLISANGGAGSNLGSTNKTTSPPPTAPAAKEPATSLPGPPPTEPSAEPNTVPAANPPDSKPLPKDPFADPYANPADAANPVSGG